MGTDKPVKEPITQCIPCPFCSDPDFDLIGLKNHLMNGWCAAFNALKEGD